MIANPPRLFVIFSILTFFASQPALAIPVPLGSTSIVTDGQGRQVSTTEYTPYGQTWTRSGVDLPHQFTGQRLDAESGLYYYGARYYDPALGRFIQPDTLVPNPGDPQEFNRYTYAGNNPLTYTDPTGHFKLGNILKSLVGAAISFFAPPLAPFMAAFDALEGISRGGSIGSILGGFAGSLVGGAAFGGIGQAFGLGIASHLGSAAFTFGGGALIGAVEFGLAGFGAGLGGTLGSGGSFSEALESGGRGAALGAATGAAIEGSYLAGWQDAAHGLSVEAIASAQLQSSGMAALGPLSRTLEQRRNNPRSIFLHGTNAEGAAGILSTIPKPQLFPGSWVTKPYALDPMTGKPAIMLNPSQYRAFAGTPGDQKGEFFALIVAPSKSAHWREFSTGGAPQWQIYGEHKVERVYPNPN